MSLHCQRHASSAAISSTTRSIARNLLLQARPAAPTVRKQLIDANQLQRLSLALDRPSLYPHLSVRDPVQGPPQGTPLPPGYHLAYFTPALLPDELGPDGADVTYNPPAPFTRRMWAGGKLAWQKDNPLRVGDDAIETTKLISSEPKRTRQGEEMIVVGVEKTFENQRGLAHMDRRDWIFRYGLDPALPHKDYSVLGTEAEAELPRPEGPSERARDFLQTPVSLFRFSALTFNAHMIHYSQPWCQTVEGHPTMVVHGPLNMINMLDFWRDEHDPTGEAIPTSMNYRATAPFYAGERYRALLERGHHETYVRLWRTESSGSARVGMLGDITH